MFHYRDSRLRLSSGPKTSRLARDGREPCRSLQVLSTIVSKTLGAGVVPANNSQIRYGSRVDSRVWETGLCS